MTHRYQGYCPDETQPDARDAECEACQSMDDLTMPELRAGIALQLREIERLRTQLAAAEARAERLLRGEFICQKCGLRKDGEHDGKPDF